MIWSFPERHGASTTPLSTEQWQALLTRVRAGTTDGDAAPIVEELAQHAPREKVHALLANLRRQAVLPW